MSSPPELAPVLSEKEARATHEPLTSAIRRAELAHWSDGSLKGNLIEVFLRAHAEQHPVLVATEREDTYEIWVLPLTRKLERGQGPPPNASWAG